MIESMGQFIGVGLGVVGLSFIAGAQSNGGNDDPSPNTKAASTARQAAPGNNKPAMPKQTIAGGVAGANNRKKQFPGMPKPAAATAGSGSAGAQSSSNQSSSKGGGALGGAPAIPSIDVANTMKELMGAAAGSSGGKQKYSYKWGAAEATGPREYMEDAWTVRDSGFPGGYFFASVMDGHGGEASSAWLRENLFKSLAASCEGASRGRATEPGALVQDGTKGGGYLAEALKTGYTSADDSLIDHIARLGEPECWSGSTCTSVLVRDDRIVCANVGDSRALLVRASKGVELTQDHRPVGTSSKGRQEMQRVVNCGGWSVGGRVCGILAVSRAFGDYEFKGGRFDLLEDLSEEPLAKKATLKDPPVVPDPDVFECARDVANDEWLVIASDGLWDTVNSQQCATFIKQELKKTPGMGADELANALVKRAIRFRTQDNVAVVVVDLRQT